MAPRKRPRPFETNDESNDGASAGSASSESSSVSCHTESQVLADRGIRKNDDAPVAFHPSLRTARVQRTAIEQPAPRPPMSNLTTKQTAGMRMGTQKKLRLKMTTTLERTMQKFLQLREPKEGSATKVTIVVS